MSHQKISSKAVIISQSVIEKTFLIIGFFLVAFGIVGLIVELAVWEMTDELYRDALGLGIFIVFVGVLLVLNGFRIRNRIKRFRHYISIISIQGIVNLDSIALKMDQSIDFVKKDLQQIINKGFFTGAALDLEKNKITISGLTITPENSTIQMETYTCSRCGASGNREAGHSSICVYCGSVVE